MWSGSLSSPSVSFLGLYPHPLTIPLSHLLLFDEAVILGFPGGTGDKESACQRRRHKRCGFDPWARKIPWRRKGHPTPVFLPEKPPGGLQSMGLPTVRHDWVHTFTRQWSYWHVSLLVLPISGKLHFLIWWFGPRETHGIHPPGCPLRSFLDSVISYSLPFQHDVRFHPVGTASISSSSLG